MEVEYADSADKHGVAREDALSAVLRHLYRVPDYDEPEEPGRPAPELFIGPARSGRWLEVMVEVSQGRLKIFHVMEARATVIEDARRRTRTDESDR